MMESYIKMMSLNGKNEGFGICEKSYIFLFLPTIYRNTNLLMNEIFSNGALLGNFNMVMFIILSPIRHMREAYRGILNHFLLLNRGLINCNYSKILWS